MTTCKNCGTVQGPFVRDRDFPNTPVCGIPRRYKFNDRKEYYKALKDRIHACLERREARYAN